MISTKMIKKTTVYHSISYPSYHIRITSEHPQLFFFIPTEILGFAEGGDSPFLDRKITGIIPMDPYGISLVIIRSIPKQSKFHKKTRYIQI